MDNYSEFFPQVLSEMNKRPHLVFAKTYINLGVALALLNLHKGFQANGYSDPTYSRSLEASISAASWIMRTLNTVVLDSKIDGTSSQANHLIFQRYFMPLYLYPAASVLLVHLTQEIVSGDEEIKAVLEDIDRAIDFTQRISVRFWFGNRGERLRFFADPFPLSLLSSTFFFPSEWLTVSKGGLQIQGLEQTGFSSQIPPFSGHSPPIPTLQDNGGSFNLQTTH